MTSFEFLKKFSLVSSSDYLIIQVSYLIWVFTLLPLLYAIFCISHRFQYIPSFQLTQFNYSLFYFVGNHSHFIHDIHLFHVHYSYKAPFLHYHLVSYAYTNTKWLVMIFYSFFLHLVYRNDMPKVSLGGIVCVFCTFTPFVF